MCFAEEAQNDPSHNSGGWRLQFTGKSTFGESHQPGDITRIGC